MHGTMNIKFTSGIVQAFTKSRLFQATTQSIMATEWNISCRHASQLEWQETPTVPSLVGCSTYGGPQLKLMWRGK